jgi:HD-GYP domain-containing protein (c-di-GMP phosphodiesterase class II)
VGAWLATEAPSSLKAMMRTAQAPNTSAAPAPGAGGHVEAELERTARLLETSVPGMRGHARRVAVYAALTAQRIGLDRAAVARIRRAGTLHDIGKSEVPSRVLRAPRRLEEQEIALVQAHAIAGARKVAVLGDEELTAIVRHHHERFDGEGYPDGLAGEEIPIGARIVAVADTFEAITSERSYRPALDQPQALELLEREAGSQLDPAVVVAFQLHCSGLRGVLMAVQQR